MADGYTAWHSHAEGTNGRYVHGVAELNVMSHFLNFIGANVNFNCDKSTLFRVTPYARAVFGVVVCLPDCPSVRHKALFYRNWWTNQTDFWHGGFLPSTLHCVIKKFWYLQNICTLLLLAETAFQTLDKKLIYRRGTARCVVSVEILPIATQQCRNYACLYDKSWTNRSYEVGGLQWADV